jgi:hypothetical protein
MTAAQAAPANDCERMRIDANPSSISYVSKQYVLIPSNGKILMGRSLSDHLKAMFLVVTKRFKGKTLPVDVRVASTKMTHNRLKALETPDYLKQQHAVKAAADAEPDQPLGTGEFQAYETEEEVSKRVKTLSDMSHYRLAALVARLPNQEDAGSPKPAVQAEEGKSD